MTGGVRLDDVRLEPIARKDAGTLANLFQLYAHDFSEHMPLALGQDGRFEHALTDAWWTEPERAPFFIRRGAELAGFALARRGSRVTTRNDVMDVNDFFVVRGARRNGVGLRAAHALFDTAPGPWEIRVRHTNVAAQAFWLAVVTARHEAFTSTPFTNEGVGWNVLRLVP